MSYTFIIGLVMLMKVLYLIDKYIHSFNTKIKKIVIVIGLITIGLLAYNFMYLLLFTDITIWQLVAMLVMYVLVMFVDKDVEGIMKEKED